MTAAIAVDPRREAWLEERKNGIGGSDASVVLGVNPYRTIGDLWREKTGKGRESATSEAAYWGTRLEGIVADRYSEVTGRSLTTPDPYAIIRHPKRPYMFATIDRGIVTIDERGPGILEVKTASFWRANDWKEGPPIHYFTQLQHYLAVTGRKWGSFAVLFGGQRFHHLDVERDDAFISMLEDACEKFWGCVMANDPPEGVAR